MDDPIKKGKRIKRLPFAYPLTGISTKNCRYNIISLQHNRHHIRGKQGQMGGAVEHVGSAGRE
ncbi:Uncharacterised protein [Yersinia intermedia]|nr:Uncharacterised protein [Yersinia intermedia]